MCVCVCVCVCECVCVCVCMCVCVCVCVWCVEERERERERERARARARTCVLSHCLTLLWVVLQRPEGYAERGQYLHQFVLHAALDAVEEAQWQTTAMHLSVVDKFNALQVLLQEL